jgi:hypothetical protein
MDTVLVTLEQAAEAFGLTLAALRRWVLADLLRPVKREGRGRAGRMYFMRGDVAALVFGTCPTCGGGFKRATLKQGHCSRLCRDRARRLQRPQDAAPGPVASN